MYELPKHTTINGEPFKIRENGDFRLVLHCFEILNSAELNQKEQIIACLMCFYEDFDELEDVLSFRYFQEAIEQMFWFFDCGQNYEQTKSSPSLIDWEKDSNLICSAVNNVAGKEIRDEGYIHWWTFMSYYMAIGDCALSNIVGIRYKLAKGEKLEKYEKKFIQDNPQYFNRDYRTAGQKAADEYVKALWNGGNE